MSDSTGVVINRKPEWYGTKRTGGIPYLKDLEISGRLIVIEGPDASGRSTQIEMLTAKLEAEGYAVLSTGLNRSEIISQGILEAKRNISLGKRTLALFYAADFADQLEHKIIPALQSGHVVLADRYIYTLMARNTVRGIARKWSSDLYSFALVPDLIFYMDVNPYVTAYLQKISTWITTSRARILGSPMTCLSRFIKYQQKLAKEFTVLKQKYNLHVIDGNRTIEQLNVELDEQINLYLSRHS